MAEIISNTIIGCVSAVAEGVTTIIRTAGEWFGIWGAAAAFLLICTTANKAAK